MIANPPLIAAEVYQRYRQKKDVAIVNQFLAEHLHDPVWREATLLLLANLKRKDATVQLHQILEGAIESRRSQYAEALYRRRSLKLEEQKQATKRLWQLAHDASIPIDQRLRAVTVFLTVGEASYPDRAQAVQTVLTLKGEEARQYLEQHWQGIVVSVPPKKVDTPDIPYIVELARQELLPVGARDEMYRIVREVVM